MAKPLKIQKRDLDPNLLSLIVNSVQSGSVRLEDLSQGLQTLINQALNSGGSGGGGYNDAVIVSRISILEANKVDKIEIANYFNKMAEKVTAGMLDQSVLDLITANAGGTVNLFEYRRKDTKIEYEDLNIPVQNKIVALETRVSNLNTTTTGLSNDVAIINSQLASLSGVTNSLNDLNDMKSEIDALQTNTDSMASAVGNLEGKMTNSKNDIAAIQTKLQTVPSKDNPVTTDLLDASLATQIKKIPTIEKDVNDMKIANNIMPGTSGQFAVFVENVGIANSNMLYCGTISKSAAGTTTAIAAGKPYIYDIADDILYIADTELVDVDKNIADDIQVDGAHVGYHYLQNWMEMYMYIGKFVYDDDTGEMIFLGDPIIEIKKPEFVTKDVIIASGASYTYATTQAFKQGLKILVLDPDSTSRTYNKYINSEGVATVSYDNNGITIYNDADISLTFKICC